MGVIILKWKDSYVCSSNRKRTANCTPHRIQTNTVNELVLDTLRHISEYARNNEADFTRQVNEMFSTQQSGAAKAQRKKLATMERRHNELDKLVQRIYEDMVAGRISEKRFDVLSAEYEQEQSGLEPAIALLQNEVDSFEDSKERAENFLNLTRRYTDFAELSPVIKPHHAKPPIPLANTDKDESHLRDPYYKSVSERLREIFGISPPENSSLKPAK